MAKKRVWYCGTCYSPCQTYKKGKHRVIICPKCEVIASNPIPLAFAGMGIAKGIGAWIAKRKQPTQPQQQQLGGYVKVKQPVLVDID